jgi:hypothetical protein
LPPDATTGVAATSAIAVTFSAALDAATVISKTDPGSCGGSLQVSTDDFASCVGLSNLTLSNGGTTVTATPTPGLSFGTTYKVRVTTSVTDTGAQPLAAQYTAVTGFTTITDSLATCTTVTYNALAISQIYGGGGNTNAPYKNDFIEIHNRSNADIVLDGMSVQYAAGTGTTWQVTPLTGTIGAGKYFLVSGASGGAVGNALPSPDVTGSMNVSATNGKIALVNSTTALAGTCPLGGATLDFVGFGSANCSETATAPAASNSLAVVRKTSGCDDTGSNTDDFVSAAPTPRNGSSAKLECDCGAESTANETGDPDELDFVVVQFPTSLTVQTGVSTGFIYGRVYELNVTEPPGAATSIKAQLGYGPRSVNPENQSGWTWVNAGFNQQYGNDEEYQAGFIAPAVGTYAYTYRFSLDGANWTYADLNGAGFNPNLSFEVTQLPILTVTP